MSTARYLVGDVFERLAEIPDGSVDLVMTSPPFLALRSYLPADHPDKHKEIGSEPTPAVFLDVLLALSAEWRRVLAPHGSIVVELGDTYSGSGGAGGDYNDGGLRDGQAAFSGSASRARGGAWPLEKSLTGIPAAYELSLAYGYNVLDRQGPDSPAGLWRIRNLIVWARPNPPVGALGDKFRPATSYLTVATVARDRWFDLDAVRVEPKPKTLRYPRNAAHYANDGYDVDSRNDGGRTTSGLNPGGAPPLDYWEISPGGYRGSHYAVYPAELCRRPIDAMCPRRVCRTCGAPSRRITGEPTYVHESGRPVERSSWGSGVASGKGAHSEKADGGHRLRVDHTTGWTTCGCPGTDDVRHDGFHVGAGWRPGLVLDPFGGSGTTCVVAIGRGRDCVLIDLDERNADLARERIGMFLEVDYGATSEPAA